MKIINVVLCMGIMLFGGVSKAQIDLDSFKDFVKERSFNCLMLDIDIRRLEKIAVSESGYKRLVLETIIDKLRTEHLKSCDYNEDGHFNIIDIEHYKYSFKLFDGDLKSKVEDSINDINTNKSYLVEKDFLIEELRKLVN